MSQGDVLYQIHGIMPVAGADLLQSHVDRSGLPAAEGQIAWLRDGFGKLRLFTFRKNISGSAFAAGDLTSRKREDEANQTGTSTTSVTGSFTANDHIGSLVIVYDATAGAAPEGEASVAVSNTSTVVTLAPELPLSAALAANNDVLLISPKVIDSADGDFDHIVCGIAMDATPDGYWGWFQFQGVHPAASHKSNTAATVGEPIVADAATVNIWGTDVASLWVGRQIAVHAADVGTTGDKSPVVMSLLPVYI